MRARAAACLALLALCACAQLPQIDSGECGNGVIEEPEDCDGLPSPSGADCRPPGSVGQCRLDCSTARNGVRPTCPSGWGCDSGGICRRPTGELLAQREIEVGSATSLLTGDFDGDQRWDIASLEPFEGAGITRIRFHYFDERAQLAETRAFPLRMTAPVVAQISDDTLSDILFSDGRVGLLRGRADRSWVPDAFSSYRIPDASIRTLAVFAGEVERTTGFVFFSRFEGVDGMYIADANIGGMPRLLATLPGPVEAFVGDPAGGRLLEDTSTYPCSQALLAIRGQSRFWLYDSCTTKPDVVGPAWRAQAEQRGIELDPPAEIDVAPQVVDMNGDGHLDVLVGAGARTYVAYGDGQNLAPAVPYVFSPANGAGPITELAMPLVAGDVTGDGAPDFVFDSVLLLSSPAASGSGFDYDPYAMHTPGYWTRALVADLNGNGKLDFVAASSAHPGVDFFNGTGTRYMTDFSIPTNRPVQHLVAGDFDGDLINDIGLTQISAASGLPDSVFIAFGTAAGPPQAPSAVAQIAEIEQLATWREGAIDHIGVSSRDRSGDRERAALAFLGSNGDRIPTAAYELTTFAADGSTDGSRALRLTSGSLLEPGHRDVLALAFGRKPGGDLDVERGLQAWLLPALASDGTPARLGTELDPELAPISMTDGGLSLSASAADLDGDGRDEVVLAMPRGDGSQCSVAWFSVSAQRLEPHGSWTIDEGCPLVELSPWDADADGAVDLLLLTAARDSSRGRLSIFWNGGSGAFDAQHRTVLSDAAPRAFTVLEGTTARPLSIAYVNAEGLFLVAATQQAREFDAPRLQIAREDCTGVVAADLNGDAAVDLAYAANGNLNILQSVLEAK